MFKIPMKFARVGALVAFAAIVAVASPVRAADLFTDGTCENATAVGRHLNELVEANSTLTPELRDAAKQMRDVYESCVTGYDRDGLNASTHGGEQFANTNGVSIGRIYARLALARSLQRVAQYDVYDKDTAGAKAALDEALTRLEEIELISPLGTTHPGTSERSLGEKAQALRAELVTAEASLGPTGAPTPSRLPTQTK